MNHRSVLWVAIVALVVGAGAVGVHLLAQQNMPADLQVEQVKVPDGLRPMQPLPACATAMYEQGAAGTEMPVLLFKLANGCALPDHWHKSNAQMMFASGVARLQTEGRSATLLRAGTFVFMPAHKVHRLTCTSGPCLYFVQTDDYFDVHLSGDATALAVAAH